MSKRKTIHKRIWLDRNNADSMSCASYTVESYDDDGAMSISIADCYKTINLSLGCRKDLRKINRLISFLVEAVDVHIRERDK